MQKHSHLEHERNPLQLEKEKESRRKEEQQTAQLTGAGLQSGQHPKSRHAVLTQRVLSLSFPLAKLWSQVTCRRHHPLRHSKGKNLNSY